MAINIIPPNGPKHGTGVNVDQVHSRGTGQAHQAPQQPGTPGADKVTLTGQAEKLQKLDEVLKAAPAVDTERVASIKAQIADGSFKVDSAAIADKLLQSDKDLGY